MMESDTYETQLAELERRLKRERQHRKQVEQLLAEKQSEAQCAVAWAQTASETVSALEEQLDTVEKEFDDVLERLNAYEKGENPWSSKEESFKQVLQQLHESQTREEEMYQQAEDMQRKLLEVQGKLKERDDLCSTYENEIERLKGELSLEERRVTELVSEFSSTADTWEQYNHLKAEMDKTLGSHLATVGINGNNNTAPQSTALETYRLEDQVHELEQLVAQAETSLLEERNRTAKLQEENESLHKFVLKLQEQLYQGQ